MSHKQISSGNWKWFTYFILFVVLAIGVFFRFYKIREYMMFLGDEGRDMMVVKRMIVDHKPTLLGPITSVGSMYMGPVYYYMMAPFLWLSNLDPVGPSIMVAMFSVLTILLIYLLSVRFFNSSVGLIASFLYAISPLTIIYGRSSWNPNVVPFFSLLLIYSLMQVLIDKKNNRLILVGLSLGILLQLHYVTFMYFLIIPVLLFIFKPRISIRLVVLTVGAFVLAYSPFLLFEMRHQFVNTQSAIRFVFSQQNRQSVPIIFSFVFTIADVFIRIFWRLVVIGSAEFTKIFMILMAIFYFIFLRNGKVVTEQRREYKAVLFIICWLITGIVSYGIYRGVIYDYYFGALFPAPFILAAFFFHSLYGISMKGKIFSIFMLTIFTYFCLDKSPLKIEPNNMLKNTQTVANSIYERTGGKPYNFALIATMNSDHAYRYFLEIKGNPPVVIESPEKDPDRKSVTDQLLVVCEEKVCQPEGHPLWEIAGFGRAQIVEEWKSVTVRAFRLIHYKGQ